MFGMENWNGVAIWRICLAVLTEYRRVTDRRTDRQTSYDSIVRLIKVCRNLKTLSRHNNNVNFVPFISSRGTDNRDNL